MLLRTVNLSSDWTTTSKLSDTGKVKFLAMSAQIAFALSSQINIQRKSSICNRLPSVSLILKSKIFAYLISRCYQLLISKASKGLQAMAS